MKRLFDLWRRTATMTVNRTPDGELLSRFIRQRDEAAFAELVDRYGPLVYGTCRRLLPEPLDVEDAFQATFLVLVRRAAQIGDRVLGPWLHQVAVWTARNLRRRNARRLASTDPLDGRDLPPSLPDTATVDARLDVDAALAILPRKYRVPVVLCHLQGWTRQEAAAYLGCPESTLASLLGRGLAKLRKRLAGRDPVLVLAVAGSVTLPRGIAAAAIRIAILFRTSSLSVAASPAVADLTQGVLQMFWLKKVAFTGVVATVFGMIGLGVWMGSEAGHQASAQPSGPAVDPRIQQEKLLKAIEDLAARVDRLEGKKETEKPAAAASGTVELTVGAGQPALELKELDKNGKVMLRVWPSDPDALRRYLTRAGRDREGPSRLIAHVDPSYPAEKVKEVFTACRAAGYEPETASGRPAAKRAPYVIETPDVLQIEVVQQRIVEGKDELGNRILVNGKPIMRQVSDPLPDQPISGTYLVRPDGTVSLGTWGAVRVDGLTLPAAKDAIRKHLLETPGLKNRNVLSETMVVSMDVASSNSKFYYVVFSGRDGEQVARIPITGNETMLDALAAVKFDGADVAEIYVARPGEGGKPWQKLGVDWKAITKSGVTGTNYQILPGDRIHVKPRK